MESTQPVSQARSDLFTPVSLGPYQLSNRIVMAPMTRNRAAEGNVPQAMNVEYYAQRASAGLIITEASQISAQGVGYPMTPGIHSDAQVEGWKAVTKAVHEKGGHIFLQLWHVGRISHPSLQPDEALPVAPSAIRPEGEAFTYTGLQPFVTPRALESDEIFNIVYDYRKAASNAMEAGFDGVEVHAANGYLLDQFLRDGSNHRDDQYGGSLENRCRLLMEVMEAVIGECGSQRVGVRLSPLNSFNDMSDSDPEALFSYVVEQLNPLDLAYLHVMEGDFAAAPGSKPAFGLQKLRSLYKGLYMVNGGYDKARGNEVISQGDADLVSYGALYISNPDLPERFSEGAELSPPDQSTFYGGDEHGYTDYPVMDASL